MFLDPSVSKRLSYIGVYLLPNQTHRYEKGQTADTKTKKYPF